ncbi:MAG: recombinase family protein, partial [Candidatus Limnocylindria bacterium]
MTTTKTGRRPAAYVRKSHRLADSAAAQLAAIRRAAATDGADPDALEVYSDVGLSGGYGKRNGDSDWVRLLADIDARRVSTVYLTVVDRASRSVEDWAGFTRRMREAGTRLFGEQGEIDLSPGLSPGTIAALVAEAEREKAIERSARAAATQAARGDEAIGGHGAPYGYRRARAGELGLPGDPARIVVVRDPDEPVEPILAAAKETAGNVMAAARLLNECGVPTRSGAAWSTRTVARVLDTEDATRVRRAGERRRRGPSDAPLSRLVACHCGQLMTPGRDRRTRRWSEVYCHVGHRAGV